jgi:hypothetical protein
MPQAAPSGLLNGNADQPVSTNRGHPAVVQILGDRLEAALCGRPMQPVHRNSVRCSPGCPAAAFVPT